MELDIKI